MNITLGSTSPLKLEALRSAASLALPAFTLKGIPAPSAVSPQPIGEEETILGATNRAQAAHQAFPDSIAIGIENGLRTIGGVWQDWAVIILLTPSGILYRTESDSLPLPPDLVKKTLESNGSRTFGEILSAHIGSLHFDPHLHLTNGKRSRSQFLTAALESIFRSAIPLS